MDGRQIGVVNLHSNGPNMLTEEGVPSQMPKALEALGFFLG
jgi:hypothetical protein